MAKTIPIIDKMFNVLDYILKEEKGVSLKKVFTSLSLSKATAYNILETLCYYDVLNKDKELNEYSFGKGLIVYKDLIDKKYNIQNQIFDIMKKASIDLNETIKLTILKKGVGYVLKIFFPENNMSVHSKEKSEFPLYLGASQKILLVNQNSSYIKKYIIHDNDIIKQKYKSEELFLKLLEKIKIQKYAFDDGEYRESIKAVAIPIFNDDLTLFGAISCVYFKEKNDNVKKEKLITYLKEKFKKYLGE